MRFSCRQPKLFLRRQDLVGGRNSVVPVVVVFHEGHAFALHRVCDDGYRFAAAVRYSLHEAHECRHVMAIHFTSAPTEGAPLVDQRTEREYLLASSRGLPLVEIDEY